MMSRFSVRDQQTGRDTCRRIEAPQTPQAKITGSWKGAKTLLNAFVQRQIGQTADLGSAMRIGPMNRRFEENGVTSQTHCVAMTDGLFRASDNVY